MVDENHKSTKKYTPPEEIWEDVVKFFEEQVPKFEKVMEKHFPKNK